MSLVHFFLSFRGRVSRQAFWLGFLFLFVLSILVMRLVDPDAVLSAAVERPGPLDTIVNLVLCWPTAAITAKRLNDRDWPGWFGPGIGVLYAIYALANAAGYFLDPAEMGRGEKLLFAGFVLVFLTALVDNGFIRGTAGPNRHGPDPVRLTTVLGD